jgi:hypothetical protein
MSTPYSLVRFPLILVLLAFVLWAAKTGLAGIYSFQAQSYLELWQHQRNLNPQYTAPPEQYEQVLQQHQNILSLTSYNGDYWTAFAEMQLWSLATTVNMPQIQQTQRKADILNAYRTALRLRPTWPYAYIRLALIKAHFGEVDDELNIAMQKAYQLGAWESDVLRPTIELGLALWPQLQAKTQQTVANAVEHAITWQVSDDINNKERIFALSLVGAYQKTAQICALMTPIGQQKANCL